MEYRRRIQVGRNVTDIMELPCVNMCIRGDDGRIRYFTSERPTVVVWEGDWLCEDTDGNWHVEKGGEERR